MEHGGQCGHDLPSQVPERQEDSELWPSVLQEEKDGNERCSERPVPDTFRQDHPLHSCCGCWSCARLCFILTELSEERLSLTLFYGEGNQGCRDK